MAVCQNCLQYFREDSKEKKRVNTKKKKRKKIIRIEIMSYNTPNARRFARVQRCYADCGRSPANPRIPHGSREWQPAYNHCTTHCSQSGGEYVPYQLPPARQMISDDCARQMQFESAGYSPTEIQSQIGRYEPNCESKWANQRYAGSRRRRHSRGKIYKALKDLVSYHH